MECREKHLIFLSNSLLMAAVGVDFSLGLSVELALSRLAGRADVEPYD